MRNQTLFPTLFFLTLVLTTFLLSGCGGGGSSSGSVPANPPPSASGGGGGTATPPTSPDPGTDVVRGAITGFGSVYVAGKRYTTDAAMFLVNDRSATQEDLAVGMVVKLSGDRQAGRAAVVRYDEDIKGPIDAIDGDTLTVVGQTVQLTPETRFDDGLRAADLQVGLFLEVSGLRGANDSLDATYVELENDPEVEVTGVVRDLDESALTFRIGGLTVDYSTAVLDDLPSGLANDLLVEAKDDNGAYSPGDLRLIATKVDGESLLRPEGPDDLEDLEEEDGRDEDDDDDRDDDDRDEDDDRDRGEVEVEGIIAAVDGDRLLVSGVDVRVNNGTRYVFGDVALLDVGVKIEVEGTVAADGVLDADKVKFSRNSARLAAQVESIDSNANSLQVFGVTIALQDHTELEDDRDDVEPFSLNDLLVGDFVTVRGLQVDSDILASELERDEDDDTELRGLVGAVDSAAGTVELFGMTLVTNANTEFEGDDDDARISSAEFFDRLIPGQTIIEAQWDGTVSNPNVPVQEMEIED